MCFIYSSIFFGSQSNLFLGASSADPNNPGATECGIDFHDNEYYTMNGSAFINCQKPALSLADWQKTGSAQNDSVAPIPDDDQIIQWAKEKLGM